mmetsp:Transcript_18103/g.59470  ORF Transcript_18103/g.59470 Transcript_18103/m.59470 type:complete len:204 (-) Transcript_18103:1120-1731(-)
MTSRVCLAQVFVLAPSNFSCASTFSPLFCSEDFSSSSMPSIFVLRSSNASNLPRISVLTISSRKLLFFSSASRTADENSSCCDSLSVNRLCTASTSAACSTSADLIASASARVTTSRSFCILPSSFDLASCSCSSASLIPCSLSSLAIDSSSILCSCDRLSFSTFSFSITNRPDASESSRFSSFFTSSIRFRTSSNSLRTLLQ